jgi:hypothetical protein
MAAACQTTILTSLLRAGPFRCLLMAWPTMSLAKGWTCRMAGWDDNCYKRLWDSGSGGRGQGPSQLCLIFSFWLLFKYYHSLHFIAGKQIDTNVALKYIQLVIHFYIEGWPFFFFLRKQGSFERNLFLL